MGGNARLSVIFSEEVGPVLFYLFYPGYPLFQGVSYILPRLPCIPLSLLPLGGGLMLPSFSLACDIVVHPSHDSTVG